MMQHSPLENRGDTSFPSCAEIWPGHGQFQGLSQFAHRGAIRITEFSAILANAP